MGTHRFGRKSSVASTARSRGPPHLWMIRQIRHADFVIAVASSAYRRLGDGEPCGYSHRGARSELRLLRELIYSDPDQWTRRILPVVLPEAGVDDIPLFLQPRSASHFVVLDLTAAGSADLLNVLVAGQHGRSGGRRWDAAVERRLCHTASTGGPRKRTGPSPLEQVRGR